MKRSSSLAGVIAIVFVILAANVVIGAAVVFGDAGTSGGDGRRLQWDRYDVVINNLDTAENRFHVVEDYDLSIAVGPFSFGYREIPLDRIERIENVQVYDGQTPLRSGCAGGAGTVCVTESDDMLNIRYYFTSQAQSRSTRDIRIEYDVVGALRSYEDGDQLYWVALAPDRAFPVLDSQVTVVMPEDRPPELTASYPDTWAETVQGNTITWEAPGPLGTDKTVEVRVQYPHNPAMDKPGWQAGFDRWRSYEDNIQPLVSLVLLGLGVLVTIGGMLLVYIRYTRRGRDPESVVVPEYLSEPPSVEYAGIVGVLLDEYADMQDIMGALVDLARRGYLVIEQKETGGLFGMFKNSEFVFHRTDKDTGDLPGFEKTLLRGIFSGGETTVELSDLKNKFYKHIPAIKEQMYRELVRRGYFSRSPESTRQLYAIAGIGLMIVASGLFWAGVLWLTRISPLIGAPAVALGITGAALALVSQAMPAKTLKGAQEAARWRAFRNYLENIDRYGIENADEKFNRYMGYAIVFGVEKDWVKQVAPAMSTMPTWYHPTYLGGPWGRGYYGGPSRRDVGSGSGLDLGGGLGRSGSGLGGMEFGGLNEMSSSLTEGLNAMSSGLTQMLNDASSAMTSRPSSSGSGGGGFSGGGGGGGGSGGGGAGFG